MMQTVPIFRDSSGRSPRRFQRATKRLVELLLYVNSRDAPRARNVINDGEKAKTLKTWNFFKHLKT